MNLGDANLRKVNSSRPQLIHVNSQQSITASDDYYSLGSDGSSTDDRTIVRRYETPPLQMRLSVASRDHFESEATIPTIRQVKQPPPDGLDPAPTGVRFKEEQESNRKPVTGDGMPSQKTATEIDTTSTTPGVDDTPYIRFAIDQLTRDEELLGPRRRDTASEVSYPVDRIVPDEGLGYYGHDERSTRHDKEPSKPPVEHLESSRMYCMNLDLKNIYADSSYSYKCYSPTCRSCT